MQEIWKNIKGFSKYQISNFGNVRKINKDYRCPKYKLLKIYIQYNGYSNVSLHDKKGYHKKLIHRLVAQAFIPNLENKPTVNHKDGNKQNNCVDNLEWATYNENLVHSINVLKINRNTDKQIKSAKIIGKLKRKLTLKQAYEIRKKVKTITRKELAKEYGVSLSVIDNILQNKRYIN